jgi:hypothetical protein
MIFFNANFAILGQLSGAEKFFFAEFFRDKLFLIVLNITN